MLVTLLKLEELIEILNLQDLLSKFGAGLCHELACHVKAAGAWVRGTQVLPPDKLAQVEQVSCASSVGNAELEHHTGRAGVPRPLCINTLQFQLE